MSIESRLLRGDDPEGVAKLFGADIDEVKALAKKLKPAPKKKAVKKAAKK